MESHYALLDYRHNMILFQMPREEEFIFQFPKTKFGKFLISALRAGGMIGRGCVAFLACVVIDSVVA